MNYEIWYSSWCDDHYKIELFYLNLNSFLIVSKIAQKLHPIHDWCLCGTTLCTLVSQIIVLHSLSTCKNFSACTSLFQSSKLLIFENFPAFIWFWMKKSNLHINKFWILLLFHCYGTIQILCNQEGWVVCYNKELVCFTNKIWLQSGWVGSKKVKILIT